MADTDTTEWRLFDTDLTTQIGILPYIESHILLEMNETGSGKLTIPLDSPVASQVTEGMFCMLFYRGASRGGFFVDSLKLVEADASEGGGRRVELSGQGALSLLQRARVKGLNTNESTRTFASVSKASILIDLILEAQARGGLDVLTYDFTAANDSDSVAWTDSEELSIPVGTTLLDVVKQFSKSGEMDISIVYSAGEFQLSAFKNDIGTNKSNTIYMRIGSNCEEVSREIRGGGFNPRSQ